MVTKEAEYREKVRANLGEVLELLKSKKVTDRKTGLEQIEQVFSHDQAVEYLEPADEGSESKGTGKTWLSVFQAIFNVVVEERRAYLSSKRTTAQENKLESAARKVRWLTKRALRKINRRLLKALISHLTQCIHDKGDIVKPLATEYSDTLYVMLSYPPHLDHITAESWNEILVLAFSGALGDSIPRSLEWTEDDIPSTYHDDSDDSDDTADTPVTGSRKRTRATATQTPTFSNSGGATSAALSIEQINFIGVVRLLIRSPHAPILHHVDVSKPEDSPSDPLSLPRILLSKFVRFFRQWPKETSGHKNAVLALSALLVELEFNAREVLSEASVALVPQLLSLWKVSTKSKDLKESLLISLRVLFPFRLLVQDGPPLDLDAVCKNLEDGVKPQKDWRPLPLESLRLILLDSDSRHGDAFCARTFQHGFNFDDQHAFVWCAMEFHADCIIESMRRARQAVEPPTPRKAKKRPRIHVSEPVGDLIRRCTRPTTPEVRYYSLQVALFVIDRHWMNLPNSDQIDVVNELTLALGMEDVTTQSLSFLCLAAIAALSSPDDPNGEQGVVDWSSLWEKGIRNAGVLSVCRAAIHMLHMILRSKLVERTQMLKDIVRLLKDVAVQGPAQPSDSVCSFFTAALRLASRDMRLHQLNLGDNVLAWLSDCWSVGPLHGSKGRLLRSYTIKDMLSLMEAICNLQVAGSFHDWILLPDSLVVEWFTERHRTDLIRRYFFESRLEPTSAKRAATETESNHRASQSEVLAAEQRMPPVTAQKCTRYLQKCIDQLTAQWEDSPDIRMIHFSQIRSALETAVLGLQFETSLKMQGIRANRKLIRSAYDLIIRLMEHMVAKTWKDHEKALMIMTLDPLVSEGDEPPQLAPFEVITKPGRSSGLRYSTSATAPTLPSSKGSSGRCKVLWQELSKSVEVDQTFKTSRDILTSFGADSAFHGADDIHDDNFASPSDGVTGALADGRVANDRSIAFATWAWTCIRLQSVPPLLLGVQGSSQTGTETLIDFFLQSNRERIGQFGPIFCEAVYGDHIQLDLASLSSVIDWFSLLSIHEYSHSEIARLLLLQFLTASMDIWMDFGDEGSVPEETDAAARIRQLCEWTIKLAYEDKHRSWRVREWLAFFLDSYIQRDPDQRFLSLSHLEDDNDSGDEVADRFPGLTILARMTQDMDARVRFRAASANARALDATSAAGVQSPDQLYVSIFRQCCIQLSRYEHMLTRFVALSNLLVVDSSLSRGPYWNLIETGFHGTLFLPHLEAVLEACARSLGLDGRSALFRAYATNVADAASKHNLEFTLLPPSLLGFQSRKEMIIESFPLIAPTYCWRMENNPFGVFKLRFAVEYIEKAGKSPKEAFLEILPDVLALRMAFFIDDKTRDMNPNFVLTIEQDQELELTINRLIAYATDANPVDVVRESWDRVTFKIVKLFADTDCTHDGPICRALRTVDGDTAADAFVQLTQFRRKTDFKTHEPNPPAVCAVTIARALKRLQSLVSRTESSKDRTVKVSSTGMVFHTLFHLMAAINTSPLLNEQFRLVNALCFHIARNHGRFKDYTLLRALSHGAIALLQQYDLAHAAQSILDWCLEQYKQLDADKLVGLDNHLSRIGQIAAEYSKHEGDPVVRGVGEELLSWVESWMMESVTDTTRPYILVAIITWPRTVDFSMVATDSDIYHSIPDALAVANRSPGKFRIVGRLSSAASEGIDELIASTADFWTLKSCIPAVADMRDGDVDAFVQLLFRSAGQVQTVPDDPLNTPSLGMRFTLSSNQFPDSKQYLILALHDMLASESRSRVDLGYRTLRATLAAGFSLQDMSVKVAPQQYIAFEIKLLNHFRMPLNVPGSRSLEELLTRDHVVTCNNFDRWITNVTLLFSGVLTLHDAFFGHLCHALESDTRLAEEAFPILTRQLLLGAPIDSPESPRRLLTKYFTQVLQEPDVSVGCRRSIIHLILHLRHFPPPGNHNPLSHNYWLKIDYLLLAQAATYCGSYTTALLFLELAAEDLQSGGRAAYDAAAEDILYTIYSHIDEPDGFYGIVTEDVRKFLLRRFTHESQWDQSFRFHGAAFETEPAGSNNAAEVVRALHNFGFDKLATQVYNRPELEQTSLDTAELTYGLGWRTENWDLPLTESDQMLGPNAILYAALQAVHRDREPELVGRKLRLHLRNQVAHLHLIGNEDMTGIRESIRLLMCLGELHRAAVLGAVSPETDSDKLKLTEEFDFDDYDAIMATRISCIRSRRTRETAEMLGDSTDDTVAELVTAEFKSLMDLGEFAIANDRTQVALNALNRAQTLTQDGTSGFVLECEFASVLWKQGEQKIAVDLLRRLTDKATENSQEIREKLPFLLSQLGEWSAQAALEKPVDIRKHYFERAINMLKSDGKMSTVERANVSHRFATFCEQQYLAHVQSPDVAHLRSTCDDLQAEVQQLEAEMRSLIGNDHREFKKYERQLKKTRDELQQYRTKYQAHVQASAHFLQISIEEFARSLAVTDTAHEVDTVIRVCSLWFSNFRDVPLNQAIAVALVNIPSHKLIFMSHQLSSRLSVQDPHLGQRTLQKVLRKLSSQHIFHTFYQLFALVQGSRAEGAIKPRRSLRNVADEPEGDEHRVEAAHNLIEILRTEPLTQTRIRDLETVCSAYLEWAKLRLDKCKPGTELPVPPGMKILSLVNVQVPIATDTLDPDPTGNYNDIITIRSYSQAFTTAGGINLPKITRCIGSDGVTRKQLFKGQGDDDMRQDAVMEQVFELVNYLLAGDRETRKRRLCVRTYKVLPLAPQAGIIEFVPDTIPLKSWLDKAHPSYRPSDMPESEAAKRLITARDRGGDVVDAYLRICQRLKPVMRHFFTEASKLPMAWFGMRLNYARSVATTSIVGHMIGLGDRHTSNILLQEQTGEVVHIDLGIAFDQGRQLAATIRSTRPGTDTHSTMDTAGGVEDPAMETDTVEKLAERALASVARKLDKSLSVSHDVQELISQATDPNNLGKIYFGWRPWL
ncbi:Serine/threonine-protein kinase tel1 [Tulasnella sp. 427]|nr:Serine/threonine-protein kinase tel1 [Tulasnella sp. 427]